MMYPIVSVIQPKIKCMFMYNNNYDNYVGQDKMERHQSSYTHTSINNQSTQDQLEHLSYDYI